MRTTFHIACAVLLGWSHAGMAETIERQAAADARGEVDIVNIAGSVAVRGWDRPEVQVRATLASSDRLEFQNDGRRTLIKVIAKGERKSSSAELVVNVPTQSRLSVNTISADQTIENVRGGQRLQAVSGEINTGVWSEEFQIKTISGDVNVQGHKAASLAAINTVSGDIVLADVSGAVELETVTGDMQVRMGELTRGSARTTNGDLVWRAQLAREARLDAETINGDVKFLFQGKIDTEFDIETFNGEIDNCFGPEPQRTREFAPGRALHFRQGTGSGRVRIKTLNGGVEICGE